MDYLGAASLVLILATLARWFQRAWRVDLPRIPSVFQALTGVALVLGVAALVQNAGDGFAMWGIGLSVVFLYLSFTGGQRTATAMIEVGDAIPEFRAIDDSGSPFDSASLKGSRVLLKFFRGHW